jgi:hypothetical protein
VEPGATQEPEPIKEDHCSDCKHYQLHMVFGEIDNVGKFTGCRKGKLLLADDPPVGNCIDFERKPDV